MRQVQTHVLVLDILGLLLRYRRYGTYEYHGTVGTVGTEYRASTETAVP